MNIREQLEQCVIELETAIEEQLLDSKRYAEENAHFGIEERPFLNKEMQALVIAKAQALAALATLC